MKKRILSLVMVLVLCLTLLPVTALAATVENITYLDENGIQQTAASATQVTNSDTQWTDGWYVAQSNITIDGTVTISGNVHLILEDGCNLTVNGGILLQSDSNMYIYAQSTEKERMGSLTATGTDAGFKEAGYGTQTLTIAGGKISASGSDVGISAVNLTITDGYVSALGTDLYGDSIAVYNATISGGFVDLYGDFTGTLSTGIDGHAVISSTGEIKNIAADCKGFFLIQKTGKIYGDTFTLTQDLNIANSNIVVTVEEGQTLTLDDGVTLTIPVIATLTNNGIVNNNGTIINTGTLNNSGTLNNNGNLNNTSVLNNAGSIINNGTLTGEVGGSGTVITTPTITTPPTSQTVTEGKTATFTVEATGGNLSYQWQQSIDAGNNWTNIDSANAAQYTTGETTMDMNGTQYRCVVKNSIAEVTSDAATLTVQKATTPIEPKYVRYIVEHYKQNADGSYTLADTEQPIDEIGKTVTATPKTYEGYTYNPNAAGTVVSGTLKAISSPDDIVTLKLYYDRTVYTITVENNGHGTASASPASAPAGTKITLTAKPNIGYHFDGWKIVSGTVTIQDNTFTMPAKNVTVKAIFERNFSGIIIPPTTNGNWRQTPIGWWYQNPDGTYPANQWRYLDSGKGYKAWYWFNQYGYMTTGWQKVGNIWYYMNRSGEMQTGWVFVNSQWYYLNSSGAMLTGWVYDGGKWYYMNKDGSMHFGWLSWAGYWYHLDSHGAMSTGWKQVNGKWYYLYAQNGRMAANTTTPDGYRVGADGAWIR